MPVTSALVVSLTCRFPASPMSCRTASIRLCDEQAAWPAEIWPPPVFNGSDFWVVVHPQGFATAAAANAWCDAQGYSPDDCYAKKLSHSGGPSGTTVTRH